MQATEIHLKSIPRGMPTSENFEVVSVELSRPKDGQITVRNQFMSVDPYMRGRMNGVKTYTEPFQTGAVMGGGAVGVITESRHPDYAVGDHVLTARGWRTAFTASVKSLSLEGLRKIDVSLIPAKAYLGVAGMPGLTAYAGLYDVAKFQPGETVLVSGAAGAVGSTVCQLAKADGGFVIGLAGCNAKCKWLEAHGCDISINYKTCGDLTQAILKAAPQGIDIYFENVGGAMLEAAINTLNPFGRIAACGMISAYNDSEPQPGPKNLIQIVGKSLKIQGFIVSQHQHLVGAYIAKLGPLLASGALVAEDTVVEGIENAPAAFLRLFSGEKQGKMLVKLSN